MLCQFSPPKSTSVILAVESTKKWCLNGGNAPSWYASAPRLAREQRVLLRGAQVRPQERHRGSGRVDGDDLALGEPGRVLDSDDDLQLIGELRCRLPDLVDFGAGARIDLDLGEASRPVRLE